jgi:hypothetical protein
MKYLCIIQSAAFLIIGGLGLCVAGCNRDSTNYDPNFSLSDYVEVVVQHAGEQEDQTSNTYTNLKIEVCLINKTPDEIHLFFVDAEYSRGGGFSMLLGTDPDPYKPKTTSKGTDHYESECILPGHGRVMYDLIVNLPKAEARHMLADPKAIQVYLRVCGIRHNGKYTKIWRDENSKVFGRWKNSL